jgi:tetratricopeptide (TPR) repeat protein
MYTDLAAGQAAVGKLGDEDFLRGSRLFEEGKPEQAEEVLVAMLGRDAHRNNRYLLLRVARLLLDHGRKAVVVKLTEAALVKDRYDAPLYNLLGLAFLEDDTASAVNAFRRALRCDLSFGAAYLNLAQAYERAGQTQAAGQCLRRYLELFPDGPYRDDAVRRLGTLEAGNR